jgi:hypothetical protein
VSLADPTVFVDENSDGSADFTLTLADDDHKFSAAPQQDSSNAILAYEETLSWRGEIRVSEPDNEVWKMLMTSDEMTKYLERQGLTGVRRERK